MRNSLLISVLAAQLLASTAYAETPAVKAAPPPPPSISVLVAEKKPIAEDLTVTGSFAAGELVLVSPEIEGLSVTEFLAEEGDQVKKGQVLARLSASTVDISIIQAQASLAGNDAAKDQNNNQIEQAKFQLIVLWQI